MQSTASRNSAARPIPATCPSLAPECLPVGDDAVPASRRMTLARGRTVRRVLGSSSFAACRTAPCSGGASVALHSVRARAPGYRPNAGAFRNLSFRSLPLREPAAPGACRSGSLPLREPPLRNLPVWRLPRWDPPERMPRARRTAAPLRALRHAASTHSTCACARHRRLAPSPESPCERGLRAGRTQSAPPILHERTHRHAG
jgi:hypothetical protein